MAAGDAQRNTQTERLMRMETQLGYLVESHNKLLTQLQDIGKKVESRDLVCAAQGPVYTNLVEKVKDHEVRLDSVEKLMPAVRALIWIGGLFGISVIGLIWAIIIGQVQVIFP